MGYRVRKAYKNDAKNIENEEDEGVNECVPGVSGVLASNAKGTDVELLGMKAMSSEDEHEDDEKDDLDTLPHLPETDPNAEQIGKECIELLKEWKLEQYAKTLIEDEGYDEVEDWKDLKEDDLMRFGFKEG